MSRLKHAFHSLPLVLLSAAQLHAATVTGEIVDSRNGQVIPARLYIQADDGRWFFAESALPAGSAIRYEKRNWINTNAVEMHQRHHLGAVFALGHKSAFNLGRRR